jgi:arsenite methyltransferase
MNNSSKYDLNDAEVISALEELSLWSAPFGIKLLDDIRYKKGINVLDIGFGMGFPLLEIAQRLGNTSVVYGIDPWKGGIERTTYKAKVLELSNIKLFDGYAENMPFDNNFFDLITSNNGLNNVQDLTKSLAECNRVAKTGAQFIFTCNSADSFLEFYDTFREVINKLGLQELNKEIDTHIYSKRKPLEEYEDKLEDAGFEIETIHNDKFCYRFADGTSFLNHFFIKLAFLDSWKNIIPENKRTPIFCEIERMLNEIAEESEGFHTQVPFIIFNCNKVNNMV